ncbi:MAG: radical SAM protein [Candidatus Sumerlaeota bacterium]|nr:radical SAM protein [Candidatus Sumerlaeota bacterium]
MAHPRYCLPDSSVGLFMRLRWTWLERRKPAPAFPLHVQIQAVTGCNADCVFCPNRKTDLDIRPGQRMDPNLFERIVDECVDGGVERISPYLMNESMLDPQLPERVAYITKRKTPRQYSKINSNGALLTERMAKGLLDAGLDRLNFSVHGIEPEPYRQAMGMPLEPVLRNIDRFLELKRDGRYKRPRVRVVMLMTQLLEPQLPAIQAYWKARGVEAHIRQIENRGAHKNIQSASIAVRELAAFQWCNRMFEQAYILHDGRMVLCCADWEQTSIMGDCSRQSIREIWLGSKYQGFRRRFLRGAVKGMLCDGCRKDPTDDEDD